MTSNAAPVDYKEDDVVLLLLFAIFFLLVLSLFVLSLFLLFAICSRSLRLWLVFHAVDVPRQLPPPAADRPLLGRTLSEEVQAVLCGDGEVDMAIADPALPPHVRSLVATAVKAKVYWGCSGLNWESTMSAERYAATTRLSYDAALLLEVDAFMTWVEGLMYLTVDEAQQHRKDVCTALEDGLQQTLTAPGTANLLDTVLHVPADWAPYFLFRRCAATAQPVAWLVMRKLIGMCDDGFVQGEILRSRVQLSVTEKQRIADQAVASAEKGARETATQQARKRRRC